MRSNDPIELVVAEALSIAGIQFLHESDNKQQSLDFYLPAHDVYIECKQFATPRTADQIASVANVIVIQGIKAAKVFSDLLLKTV